MSINSSLTPGTLIQLINSLMDEDLQLLDDSPLVGGNSLIDSMSLVQICLALEERSLLDNFHFDWTSEKAMSSLNSIFKSPETLAKEYNRQFSESNK